MKRGVVYGLYADKEDFLERLKSINQGDYSNFKLGLRIRKLKSGDVSIYARKGLSIVGSMNLTHLIVQTENLGQNKEVDRAIKNLLAIADSYPDYPNPNELLNYQDRHSRAKKS